MVNTITRPILKCKTPPFMKRARGRKLLGQNDYSQNVDRFYRNSSSNSLYSNKILMGLEYISHRLMYISVFNKIEPIIVWYFVSFFPV